MTKTAIIATSSVNVNSTDRSFNDCIKTQNNLTNTQYYNICTGDVQTVPTGMYDYILSIPFAIAVICMALFIVVGLIKFTAD